MFNDKHDGMKNMIPNVKQVMKVAALGVSLATAGLPVVDTMFSTQTSSASAQDVDPLTRENADAAYEFARFIASNQSIVRRFIDAGFKPSSNDTDLHHYYRGLDDIRAGRVSNKRESRTLLAYCASIQTVDYLNMFNNLDRNARRELGIPALSREGRRLVNNAIEHSLRTAKMIRGGFGSVANTQACGPYFKRFTY